EAVVDVPPDRRPPPGRGDRTADAQGGDLLVRDAAEALAERRVRQAGVETVAHIVQLARDGAGTVVIGGLDRVAPRSHAVLARLLEAHAAGIARRIIT